MSYIGTTRTGSELTIGYDGNGTINLNGGLRQNVTGSGGDISLAVYHAVLLIGHASTPLTATLPTATSNDGRTYTIKNINTAVVTVNTTSSQTIDGSTTRTLNQYDSITVIARSGTWYVI